jgi:hypothetical protein
MNTKCKSAPCTFGPHATHAIPTVEIAGLDSLNSTTLLVCSDSLALNAENHEAEAPPLRTFVRGVRCGAISLVQCFQLSGFDEGRS